jgi:hypothetical protein
VNEPRATAVCGFIPLVSRADRAYCTTPGLVWDLGRDSGRLSLGLGGCAMGPQPVCTKKVCTRSTILKNIHAKSSLIFPKNGTCMSSLNELLLSRLYAAGCTVHVFSINIAILVLRPRSLDNICTTCMRSWHTYISAQPHCSDSVRASSIYRDDNILYSKDSLKFLAYLRFNI